MPTIYPQENSTSLFKVETAVKKPLNIDWTPVVPLSKVQIPSSKAPAADQRDSLPSEEAEGDWTLYCRGPALHKAVQEELKQNPVTGQRQLPMCALFARESQHFKDNKTGTCKYWMAKHFPIN